MVFRNVTNGILTRLNAETNYTIWMTASTENKEGEKSALTTVQTCKCRFLLVEKAATVSIKLTHAHYHSFGHF